MNDNSAVPTDVTMRELTALVREFTASGWSSLELDIHGMHLVLGRDGAPSTTASARVSPPPSAHAVEIAATAANPPAAPATVTTPAAATTPAPATTEPLTRTSKTTEVRSPVVGAFWVSPSPGEAPFVAVGDRVEAGQQLGIVEVMKLMSNVSSPVTGHIVAIEAQNADMVEYDQVLFLIEADDD